MPAPLTLNTPGRWGVNEQEQNQLLHPYWATKADGLVINDSGNLQCRGALDLVSTDGAPAEILRQFVYVTSAGVETVISTTATKIISGVGDLDDASTDITPTGAPTNGFWQFQNFNGKVVGWQASHTPIVWSGSGDFATITAASGTLPDGDCVCAAFGRLWAVDDDGQTVRYCALLDETRWDAADGGGSIDMRNVWPKGMDRVVAIAAFGANLIIFGRRSIVIYTDGSGSALGLDPETMYVIDTIEGTGCASRDSVVVVGEGDLLFLSELGLQSFARLVIQKDNPLETISWQIADRLADAIKAEIASATDLRTWTGHYIPQTGQYMLTHTTNEDVYVFHIGGRAQDEKGRSVTPITIWDTSILTNIRGFITLRSGVTYTTGSATHEIYKYDTALSLDEGNAAIAVEFNSGWLDFGEEVAQVNKLLKMVQLTVLNPAGIDSAITLKYAADYSTTLDSLTPVLSKDESRIVFLYDPSGDIEGQYFKLGFSDTSFGRKVLTQIQTQIKTGRTAFIHKKFDDVADETFDSSFGGGALDGSTPSRGLTNPYAQPQTVSIGASDTSFNLSLANLPGGARVADSVLIIFLLFSANTSFPDLPVDFETTLSGNVGGDMESVEVVGGGITNGVVGYFFLSDDLVYGDQLQVNLASSPGVAATVQAVIYGISPSGVGYTIHTESSAATDLTVDDTPSKANAAAAGLNGIIAVAGARNDFDTDNSLLLLQPIEPDAISLLTRTSLGMLCAVKCGLADTAIGGLTGEVEMTNAQGSGTGMVAIVYEE